MIQNLKNSAHNHASRLDREGIVECTKRGKAGGQKKEKENFQPQQSQHSLQLHPPPPSSSQTSPFLPHFTKEGRKWGKHPGISTQLRAQEKGVK